MQPDTQLQIDVQKIREDFPILQREVRPGVKLVYLNSAATSQKPWQVLEAMDVYYKNYNANIHRGVHTLAEEATAAYEAARANIANFIGAAHARQVVFTRNTTESINLVAYSWGRKFLQSGDVVLLTEMEHHSNLVPWQILAAERGIQLKYVPVTDEGLFDMEAYYRLLELRPKLVGFTHMSNVLGTINPAREIVTAAHEAGAVTLVDAAQSTPHMPVDVQDINADFLAFSAHKMLGPTGIGALYGRESLLNEMPPFFGGGDMIKKVTLEGYLANTLPHKFEAGTPAIAEAIGFGAAIDYLRQVGMDAIAAHEHDMAAYAQERLSEVPGLKLVGPPAGNKGAVMSFTMDEAHPHDVAQILDSVGIAVRAGHHCAMPLHQKYCLPATTRASFYLYNIKEEVDALITGLQEVKRLFG